MVNTELGRLQAASLVRRLAALFYDSLLVFSVVFFAGLLVLPWLDGKPNILYYFYLIIVAFGYFGWQWRVGGQTLGMAVWRIQVQTLNGQRLTWRQAIIRFGVAIIAILPCGLGFLWSLINTQKRTWHDLAADTWVVYLPKNNK